MPSFGILDASHSVTSQAKRAEMASEIWLRWQLEQLGVTPVAPHEADVLLVTACSPETLPNLARLRKLAPTRTIIVGGGSGYEPYTFGLYADVVCVGNGERMVQTLVREGVKAAAKLPEAWVHGDSRPVEVATGFPWRCPPIQGGDSAYRVWAGRGCKRRCLFCQTGWCQKFEDNPDPEYLLATVERLKAAGLQYAYLSNDISQHKFYDLLPKDTMFGSYTLEGLRHDLPASRDLRIGVEGVSERLRAAVGKPIKTQDLLDCTLGLNAHGKSVRWFLIRGLPGETQADWDELRDVVTMWKRRYTKGHMGLSFTSYCPMPAAPLSALPLDNDLWEFWREFRHWYIGGPGYSMRLTLKEPAGAVSRAEYSAVAMGLSPDILRRGGSWGPNDRVAFPHKHLRQKALESYCRSVGLPVPAGLKLKEKAHDGVPVEAGCGA